MTHTLMLAITARVRLNHLAQPMTLTGTLPGATVGAAYDAHLTLGGTFVAPVTIDASVGTIPAWMTVTVTGTDVAFSGTPASGDVGTDTFTVRATDSTTPTAQVATSPQSVVVSAAGSVTIIGNLGTAPFAIGQYGTNVPLPVGCAAGDYLIFAAEAGTSGTLTKPATASIVKSVTSTSGNKVNAQVCSYVLTAADITNGYVNIGFNQSTTVLGVVLRGVASMGTTPQAIVTSPDVSSPYTQTVPTMTPANGSVVVLFVDASPTSSAVWTVTPPAGYVTQTQTGSAATYPYVGLFTKSSTGSAESPSVALSRTSGQFNVGSILVEAKA